MTAFLGNAISLNMLPPAQQAAQLCCHQISEALAARRVGRAAHVVNAIGHADLAAIVATTLAAHGVEVPARERVSLVLRDGDELIVAQATGARLPEGCTELPEGAKIVWWSVTVEDVPVA